MSSLPAPEVAPAGGKVELGAATGRAAILPSGRSRYSDALDDDEQLADFRNGVPAGPLTSHDIQRGGPERGAVAR
jgi:hypothetical protein